MWLGSSFELRRIDHVSMKNVNHPAKNALWEITPSRTTSNRWKAWTHLAITPERNLAFPWAWVRCGYHWYASFADQTNEVIKLYYEISFNMFKDRQDQGTPSSTSSVYQDEEASRRNIIAMPSFPKPRRSCTPWTPKSCLSGGVISLLNQKRG
jgi:hypothetical protein